MDKRTVPRYRRRIALHFWSQDDKTPRKGFTQNVSVVGMFVSTNAPFKPGTRIFLEIPSGKDKLVFQAEVRFSARVDLALQRVKPSGMGIRLLRVDEVMGELLKLKAAAVEVIAEKPKPKAAAVASPDELSVPAHEVFPISFATPRDLVNSYTRDIKYGGLFIASPEPAEQDEPVVVEFRFAWDESQVIQVQAQVVKKFALAEGSVTGEAVSGMGVAFSDLSDVMTRFAEVISDLEKRPRQDAEDG
jgi:Tfp pilus assembly protein PilZ